jgi:hypothetical protein
MKKTEKEFFEIGQLYEVITDLKIFRKYKNMNTWTDHKIKGNIVLYLGYKKAVLRLPKYSWGFKPIYKTASATKYFFYHEQLKKISAVIQNDHKNIVLKKIWKKIK